MERRAALLISSSCLLVVIASLVSIAPAAAATPDARGLLAPPAIGATGVGSPPAATLPDYPELPNWPRTMGFDVNYAPGEGPATVDVDGDGRLEVFAGSTDKKLYAWRIDGTAMPGFPITLAGMVQSSPAVGDIDGDHVPEVLIATANGYVYAFHVNGTPVAGWPKHPGGTISLNSVVLEDLDADGTPEVIVAAGNSLYVWQGDGTNLPGFPVSIQSSYGAVATPAIGDIDGDGRLEIVVEGWEWLNVFHQDGTIAAGWPYHLPLSYEGFSYSAPALVDFDHDGKLEIAAGYHESGGGNWSGKVAVWRYDGTVAPGWPYVMEDFGSWDYSTPAVADVDQDGAPEFAMDSHNGRIYVFKYSGALVPGFPVETGYYNLEASCAIADINDDGRLEICFGSNQTPGAYLSYEPDGTVTPGFPLAMTAAMMVSGSCVADCDGNGQANICAHDKTGNVHMWNLPFAYHADRAPWVRPHHDDHHTGRVGRSQAGVGAISGADGWAFYPVYPNPTAGAIRLGLRAPSAARVTLSIVDPAGRSVTRPWEGWLAPGENRLGLDVGGVPGAPLAPGVYVCRCVAGGRSFARTFVYLP